MIKDIRLTPSDVEPISAEHGMYLQPGDVALVRSQNVPQLGDHIIVVTGHPVMKEHGLRPQTASTPTSHKQLLDVFMPHHGLVLLKLKPNAKRAFHLLNNIQVNKNTVIFPNR